MPTALAVSPHLDDAVFSAGGTLARLAREGWRVVVATVFTASVPSPRGFALACQLDKGLAAEVDYMALRRDEDATACTLIGAEPHWCGFAEAPHRGYHSAEALFAGLRKNDSIIEAIAPALSALIQQTSPDLVLSPQAIGAHVDHLAVHMALGSCSPPHWHWADFPYAVRSTIRSSPFESAHRDLGERRFHLDRADMKAKTNAAVAYVSQIGFQFGGPDKALAAIARAGLIETFRVSHEARA